MQGFVLNESHFTLAENVASARSLVASYRVPRRNRLITRTDQAYLVTFAAETVYSITAADVTAGNATVALDAKLVKPGNSALIANNRLLRAWLRDISAAAVEQWSETVAEGAAATATQITVAYDPTNEVYLDFSDTTAAEAANDQIYIYHQLGEGAFYFAKNARSRAIDQFSDAFVGPFDCGSFLQSNFLDRDQAEKFPAEFVVNEQEVFGIYLESDEVIDWGNTVEGTDINTAGVFRIRIPVIFEPIPIQVQVPAGVPA